MAHYSMAMLSIMRTHVGKIGSCERTQSLYQKLYQTVLICQNKIIILQQIWMQCMLLVGDHTDNSFQSIENAVGPIYIFT